ncbi:MAG TPA: FAD-dependent oxidoreductase [Gaiellaceae bacterium]
MGAGPYGLAAAAHLRRAGVEPLVFGEPMSFWRGMPAGMLLRSNWPATCIAEHEGELSLDAYRKETGARFGTPVPLERFVEYGEWVQRRAVPEVDRRRVTGVRRENGGFRLEVSDGETVRAKRVVVACGIERFRSVPAAFAGLPRELASHTGEHRDLGVFAGRRLAVVGGGQSALESAALAHEGGAAGVEIFVRASRVVWLRGHGIKKRLGRLGPVAYAPTDVGPLWYSRLVAVPELFRRLPRAAQNRIARRSIRPAGAHWLLARLEGVPIHLDDHVVAAEPADDGLRLELSDGSRRVVDHLLLGTGYRVDLGRYEFLEPTLLNAIRQANGYPLLGRGLESSVPGLHFLGAPAAWSFGPIMRFVSGSWYSSRALTRLVYRDGARAGRRPPRSATSRSSANASP